MSDTGPIHDWQHLFARCEQAHRSRADWERSRAREVASSRLPSAVAPATETQIAREEARLGTRLPPSLRSFYLQSNGYGAVGDFIREVRSVEQIGWLRDVVPHLFEICVDDDAAVARCLVVSGDADAMYWLLDPADLDAYGEWQSGSWASWYPGMRWVAQDFFGLFEDTVASAERQLAREQSPPPPPGTGRRRNEQTIGKVTTVVPEKAPLHRGYMYVPAGGFASVVTISAPLTARVGEWVHLSASRRNGPWNPVRLEKSGQVRSACSSRGFSSRKSLAISLGV